MSKIIGSCVVVHNWALKLAHHSSLVKCPVTPVTEADDRQAPFSEKVMRYAIYYPLALSIVKKKKNVSFAHLI